MTYVRAESLKHRAAGLRVRCSAYPNVHRRIPVQVTAVRVPPWTALDLGELQLKLQLEPDTGRVRSPEPSSFGCGRLRKFAHCPVFLILIDVPSTGLDLSALSRSRSTMASPLSNGSDLHVGEASLVRECTGSSDLG